MPRFGLSLCLSRHRCKGYAPSVPTGLQAVAGNQQVTLSWNGAQPHGSGLYHVYQGTTNVFADAAMLSPDTTGASDEGSPPSVQRVITGLTNGTTYYFWLTAYLGGNVSQPTSTVSATPHA